MNNNYNEDYQYDSCIARGLCSINPRTSALQEILIVYLKLAAFYTLNLYKKEIKIEEAKDIILDTISVMVSNPEFSENDFAALLDKYNKILPKLIEQYKNIYQTEEIFPKDLQPIFKFNEKIDIIEAIRQGEKEFLKRANQISLEIRDLYKILFVLAKSICINVIDLESLDENADTGFIAILEILDSLNEKNQDTNFLKEFIYKISDIDNQLMNKLNLILTQKYGKRRIKEVSYSTTPSKAILVVGSNIKELENILEAVKDTDIDVYTHDEMILANTYPHFEKYKNLKGQYGQGLENCLLDFATFPGPIILTQHSLYNVENLYRGRLYTTDFVSTKGIISIKNNDFSEVIKATEETKGFKTGRQCESINLGYDIEELNNEIKQKINTGKYKKILIIALGGYTLEQKIYFEKFLKQIPEDILAISLSYCEPKDNIICINACFDSYAPIEIFNTIRISFGTEITIVFPKCDRHTMSEMIYLSKQKNTKIFVGKCTPIILNPNLITTLKNIFNINGLTSVKKDIKEI